MSAWKSRWSWVRLVKRATSKWIASARCRLSACEETSIAQARSPPSSMRREGRLQVDRLRRRPHHLLLDPADDLLHRPQQAALRPGRLEDLAQEEGGRRLAVGAGDADHLQPRRRVALEARRQRRHRRPRVGDHDLRRADRQLALDHQRRRPRLDHVDGEVVAVDARAGDAEEERAGPRLAAVEGEVGDLGGAVADDPVDPGHCRDKLVQPHCAPILGRARAPSARRPAAARRPTIPAGPRGRAARRRRFRRRPVPPPSRRRFRTAAGRRSPRRGTSGPGPGRSR